MTLVHTLNFFATLAVALAVTPTAPGPGDTFPSGGNCTINWTADTTGTWTNMTIKLMSGSNDNQSVVQTVAILDGTDSALAPYNWTCPQLDPYSAIYFYEFIDNAETPSYAWTTRFTIASPTGDSVPPEHATQPNGDAIPWGTGNLTYVETALNSSASTNTSSTDSPSNQSEIVAPLPIAASSPDPTTTKHSRATPTLALPQDKTPERLDNPSDTKKQVKFDDSPARAQSLDDDATPQPTHRSRKGMKTMTSAAPAATDADEGSQDADQDDAYPTQRAHATHPHAVPSAASEETRRSAGLAGERTAASSGHPRMNGSWAGALFIVGTVLLM